MSVTKIMSNLNTTDWIKTTGSMGTHGAYIIAIKESKTSLDKFDISDLNYFVMEVGIESGITDKPITVTRVKLNFKDDTSSDPVVNSKTACVKLGPMPSTLYFKVVGYGTPTKEYTDGNMPVSVNVLPF